MKIVSSNLGHTKVVELLLNAGIDINATDDWSSTPLYAASFHGNERVVEILLQNGAKINTKMSALDVAIENGSLKENHTFYNVETIHIRSNK